MLTLDNVDRTILTFLQDDARLSFAAIARKTGIDESTVRYRVNRLKETGVIVRFATLLDPRKVGLPLTAMVLIQVEPKHLNGLYQRIVAMDESYHVFQSTGDQDFLIIVHARDMNHLTQTVEQIKKLPGITRSSFNLITAIPKIGTALRL